MTRRHVEAGSIIAALAAVLGGSGCTQKLAPPPTAPALRLFTPDSVQVIFDRSCAVAGCHIGPTPAASEDLSPGSSYAMIVSHPSIRCAPLNRIEPFHPESSCLMERINGRVTPTMPLGRPRLPAGDTLTIHDWIVSGAPGTLRAPTP